MPACPHIRLYSPCRVGMACLLLEGRHSDVLTWPVVYRSLAGWTGDGRLPAHLPVPSRKPEARVTRSSAITLPDRRRLPSPLPLPPKRQRAGSCAETSPRELSGGRPRCLGQLHRREAWQDRPPRLQFRAGTPSPPVRKAAATVPRSHTPSSDPRQRLSTPMTM